MYVPILKAKEGEYGALEELYEEEKLAMMPLLEIPPIPFDYVNGQPSRTLEAHVSGIARRLQSSWGTDRPIYVDFTAHVEEEFLEGGQHALATILAGARELDVQVVPVVYLDSSLAVTDVVAMHGGDTALGVCLRLTISDFDEEINLEDAVGRMLETLGMTESQVDLLLDLRDIHTDVQRSVLVVRALLAGTPNPTAWRRLIVAAGSFPEDLSEVGPAAVATLPRSEWALWKALQRRPERLPRTDLVYSDYGITHPTVKELDPRTMRMSASIRYTGSDDWVVVKGRNVRQFGFDQYFALAEELIRHPEYKGAVFSWGDGYIKDTADRNTGPGNATTWRKVGTNHHLTLVTIDLATLTSS